MRWVFWTFLFTYLAALGVFVSNVFGWFGQTPDPLAGIFLLPFGLPWNLIGLETSDPFPLIIGLFAPLINLAIIYWIWRKTARAK